MIFKCPNCYGELQENSEICPKCGKKIEIKNVQSIMPNTKTCDNCHANDIDINEELCPHCGSKHFINNLNSNYIINMTEEDRAILIKKIKKFAILFSVIFAIPPILLNLSSSMINEEILSITEVMIIFKYAIIIVGILLIVISLILKKKKILKIILFSIGVILIASIIITKYISPMNIISVEEKETLTVKNAEFYTIYHYTGYNEKILHSAYIKNDTSDEYGSISYITVDYYDVIPESEKEKFQYSLEKDGFKKNMDYSKNTPHNVIAYEREVYGQLQFVNILNASITYGVVN